MYYLIFIIFFLLSYILPFLGRSYYIIKFPGNDFVWQPAMETLFIGFLLYLMIYLIRFFVFFIVSIVFLFHSKKINKIFKHNSLILFLLFILDNIILLISIKFGIYEIYEFNLFAYAFAMILLSLSITYFPFWLVFGIRNLIHYVKDLKNKKTE